MGKIAEKKSVLLKITYTVECGTGVRDIYGRHNPAQAPPVIK
jgi:hypothetical protein